MAPPRFVRDTAGFAISQYLSRIVQLLRGIIAARLLGPAAYGSWNALLLVLDYGILSQLGLQQGLDQEIPGAIARGDEAETRRLKQGGVSGMVGLWTVFAVAVGFYLVFAPRRLAEGWGVGGVLLMVLAVLLQELIFYHGTLLRSHGRIGVVSKALSLQAIVGGVVGIGLVFPFGMWGLLEGWLAGQLAALVYLRREGAPIAPLAFVPNAGTRQLLRRGFPIFLFMAASMVLKSVDRIMILKFLSIEALGYYSIGLMGVSMLLYIPDSVSYVLYPRMLATYARSRDADVTAREMLRPLATVAWLMPLIVGVSVFFVREVVALVLPKYLPGVPALSILLFGTLGLALSSIPAFYIMAIQKQVKLLPLALGSIVLDIALIGLFLRLGWKLEGVAAGVSTGYVVYGVGLLIYAASHLATTFRGRAMFVLRSVLPTLWATTLAVTFALVLPPLVPDAYGGWGLAGIEAGLFIALYLAAARALQPRTGIVAMLRQSESPFARMIAGAWSRD
ncbi:MAG: oligosaccharide flippase family protein [Candidatus Eisenbacteria bacterium]